MSSNSRISVFRKRVFSTCAKKSAKLEILLSIYDFDVTTAATNGPSVYNTSSSSTNIVVNVTFPVSNSVNNQLLMYNNTTNTWTTVQTGATNGSYNISVNPNTEYFVAAYSWNGTSWDSLGVRVPADR